MSLLQKLPIAPENKKGWPWTVETDAKIYDTITNYPKISIVTPSFNQGKFLEETIRSVLLQNYPNLEYIIIDGGSTDNSVEIIKKYEPWLTYWESEKDRGQSHAINKGIKKCSGDWFNWLNSDDILFSDALFNIAKNCDNEVKLISGNCIFSNDKFYQSELLTQNNSFYQNVIASPPQPSTFINFEPLKEISIDENFHHAMDLNLFAYYFLNFKIKRIDNLLSYYRLHDESKTVNDSIKFAKEDQIVFFKLLNTFPKFKVSGEKLVAKFGFKNKIEAKYNCNRINEIDYEMILDNIKYFLTRQAIYNIQILDFKRAKAILKQFKIEFPKEYSESKIIPQLNYKLLFSPNIVKHGRRIKGKIIKAISKNN